VSSAASSGDWTGYYDGQGDREPRDLLLQALRSFDAEGRVGMAVDLGAGQGFETAELLRRGWEVLAIDAEEEGIRRLRERIPDEHADRLRTLVSPMQETALPPADLVHASFSLPFCPPEAFPDLWRRIRSALTPGGRFVGELFGDRDSWASDPDMTFHDASAARARFDGLELESFDEEEEDGEAFDGPKHWHVFHVIARRPARLLG
jgi:SAM-dependent methyltransferase